MTDYCSNRLISEAYRRMCEWTNPDGTIDDRSIYHKAAARMAGGIMRQIRLALAELAIFDKNEENVHFDISDRHGVYVETDKPITPGNLYRIIDADFDFFEDKIADFLESSGTVRIGRLDATTPVYTLIGTVSIPISFRTASVPMPFNFNGIGIRVNVKEGYSETGHVGYKGALRSIWSDSDKFRKNLHAPDFPDRKMVIRSNRTGISNDEILKAVAAHFDRGVCADCESIPRAIDDSRDDNDRYQYNMTLDAGGDRVKVIWRPTDKTWDDYLETGDESRACDWNVIDEVRYA